MDIKQALMETLKSAKFTGATVDFDLDSQKRLQINGHLRGVIDLPGNADEMVVNIAHMLGLGKPSETLQAG